MLTATVAAVPMVENLPEVDAARDSPLRFEAS